MAYKYEYRVRQLSEISYRVEERRRRLFASWRSVFGKSNYIDRVDAISACLKLEEQDSYPKTIHPIAGYW